MEQIRNNYLNTNILKGRELKKIIFYNEGGEIFESRYGYLERNDYPTTIDGLDLSSVRKANKANFTKKDNFYISSKDYFNNLTYDLYIYTGKGGDIQIVEDFETSKEMKDGENWITRNLTIKGINFYFKEYKRNNSGEFNYQNANADTITISQHARIEKTEERKKMDDFRYNFNEKYHSKFYSDNDLKNAYKELKEFFEGGANVRIKQH